MSAPKSDLARQDEALALQAMGRHAELKKIAPYGISPGGRPLTATGGLMNWSEWDKLKTKEGEE